MYAYYECELTHDYILYDYTCRGTRIFTGLRSKTLLCLPVKVNGIYSITTEFDHLIYSTQESGRSFFNVSVCVVINPEPKHDIP